MTRPTYVSVASFRDALAAAHLSAAQLYRLAREVEDLASEQEHLEEAQRATALQLREGDRVRARIVVRNKWRPVLCVVLSVDIDDNEVCLSVPGRRRSLRVAPSQILEVTKRARVE